MIINFPWLYKQLGLRDVRLVSEGQQLKIILKYKGNPNEGLCEKENELVQDEENIKFLKNRVHNEELVVFSVPLHLEAQATEIQTLNRGLKTIYNGMIMKRRSYLRLKAYKKEKTAQGEALLAKIKSFVEDAEVLIGKIEDMHGKSFPMPPVFGKPYVIIK